MDKEITLRDIKEKIIKAERNGLIFVYPLWRDILSDLNELEKQIETIWKEAHRKEDGSEKSSYYNMGIAITCEKILGENSK